MKALIILNGVNKNDAYLKELALNSDYIICADGGYNHAVKNLIMPNLLVGDFDSCNFDGDNIEIVKYPAEKDFTDAEIAIENAILRGAKKIILTCTLGGRVDHEITNIFLLSRYLDLDICINEYDTEIFTVKDKFKIKNKFGLTVSVIPIIDSVISLDGFKYPLDHENLKIGTSLGMSNIIDCDESVVTVHQGAVLVFINKTGI